MSALAKQLRSEAALIRAEAERRATALEDLADRSEREAANGAERMVDGGAFGIAVTTWRRACSAGEIEGARMLGRKYVAPRASVEMWLAGLATPRALPSVVSAPVDDLDELLARARRTA